MRFYFRCTVELGMGDSGWIEMGEMELRSLLAFVGRGPDKDQVTTRLNVKCQMELSKILKKTLAVT